MGDVPRDHCRQRTGRPSPSRALRRAPTTRARRLRRPSGLRPRTAFRPRAGECGTHRSEVLRAAPRVFLAESLPIARTNAQSAHLAMYNLREDVFLAASGTKDDLRYAPLDRLVSLAEEAGGIVETAETLEVNFPHFLAHFPRTLIEAIGSRDLRERLVQRWDDADAMLRRYGEDHPPVGVVVARRT